jgi:hypothetical protein
LIDKAVAERRYKNPNAKFFQKADSFKFVPQSTVRKGATKPKKNELFKSLLEHKDDPKTRRFGVGNATMGMKFKSVNLGQGRSDLDAQVRFRKHLTLC